MYTTLLNFLVAIPIHLFAPVDPQAVWSWESAAIMAAFPVAAWVLLRLRYRMLTAQALTDPARTAYLRPRFFRMVALDQSLLLLPYALFVYATDYESLVAGPVAPHSEALSGFLGLAPYLLLWFLLWWEAYPLQGVLTGTSGTRASHMAAHARMELPAVAPWFAVLAVGDLLAWLFPGLSAWADSEPWVHFVTPVAFLLLAGAFLPVLVIRLWGCAPIPAGDLRDRLTSVADQAGLNVRDILFWPLLQGRVMTAGIVGLVPRFRYLLVTPSLARLLSPREMDAVVAHEAGHVRHRHLWFHLLFFSGVLVFGLGIFFRLAEAALAWWGAAHPELLARDTALTWVSLAITAGVAGVVLLGLRVLFGGFSRAFERQADLFALETLDDPNALAAAFERLSDFSGGQRDLPSWHHGSLGERIEFLHAAYREPDVGRAHHRKVRRYKLAATLLVALLAVTAGWLERPQTHRALELASRRAGLERFLAKNPESVAAWINLGGARLDGEDESGALAAFRRALSLDPADPEALNGAAWVLVTARDPALRDHDQALRLALAAARIKPAPHILDTLAEAEFLSGDRRSALALIERALALTPPGDSQRAHYERQRRRFLDQEPPRML